MVHRQRVLIFVRRHAVHLHVLLAVVLHVPRVEPATHVVDPDVEVDQGAYQLGLAQLDLAHLEAAHLDTAHLPDVLSRVGQDLVQPVLQVFPQL